MQMPVGDRPRPMPQLGETSVPSATQELEGMPLAAPEAPPWLIPYNMPPTDRKKLQDLRKEQDRGWAALRRAMKQEYERDIAQWEKEQKALLKKAKMEEKEQKKREK